MDIFDLFLVALNYFEKVDYFDRKKKWKKMLETYSSRLMGSVVVLVFFLFRCDRPENCKQTAAKNVHKKWREISNYLCVVF